MIPDKSRFEGKTRFFVLLITGCLLLLSLPASAQTTPWTAWLYNANGTITHVSSDGGVIQETALPTVQGHDYPERVAVSRGGQIVAYVTHNPQLNVHRVVLYNLSVGVVTGDIILTDVTAVSLDYHAHPAIFNEGDSALALGFATADGIWRIDVIDTASGAVLNELRAGDPATTAINLGSRNNVVPVVAYMQGGDVVFKLQAVDGEADDLSYRWDIDTGEVSPHVPLRLDTFDMHPATGELVMPMPPETSGQQGYALYAYTPTNAHFFPFHQVLDRTFTSADFIQNGERILAGMPNRTWRIVERDGSIARELSLEATDLFPLVDGFIYLTPTNPALLMVADTRGGSGDPFPVGQAAPDALIQLAWAGSNAAPPDSDYMDWLDLLDTVSVARVTQQALLNVTVPPQPTMTPTPFPTEPEFFVAPTPVFLPTPRAFQTQLTTGIRAIVTRAGHSAGLHIAPEANAPALILLYTDMVVDVLEGPEIIDGYIWWRVQTEVQGRTHIGWAIEGAQGEAWLVPMLTP